MANLIPLELPGHLRPPRTDVAGMPMFPVPMEALEMAEDKSIATIEADFGGHPKYLSTYNDEGAQWPVWEDEFTEAKLFAGQGEAFIYAAEWGLGRCTIVSWRLTQVERVEVVA